MRLKKNLLILFFFLYAYSCSCDTVSCKVFLVGNTAVSEPDNLQLLSSLMQSEPGEVVLIYCGDILDNRKPDSFPSQADSVFIRSLLSVGGGKSSVSIYFLPGDQDWNNSGKKGLMYVRRVEKLINDIAGKNIFLPGNGCPGPEVISLGDLDIVFISTPWLIHPYDKPHAPDASCKVLEEPQFQERLRELIEDAENRNLLVVGHHPAISYGRYSGRISFKEHLLPPVLSTFISAYHLNIGSPGDMAFPAYRQFSEKMQLNMQEYSPFIYASAHEYDMQVISFENAYQVVSGAIGKCIPAAKSAGTVYRSRYSGFINLDYYHDGKVVMNAYETGSDHKLKKIARTLYASACVNDSSKAPLNTRFIPCREATIVAERMNPAFSDSSYTVAGGEQYEAGFMKKLFMGNLYRTSWTTPVNIPFLNLDTTMGGLKATGRGGGRQTRSLSLNGSDGRSYVFRSVDKDPIKALDPAMRKTFILGLSRQVTATQHPYGALAVNHLLNSTGILHANPALYILPDDPKLGVFRDEYGNMPGMLEEKPKKSRNERPGTFNADDVVRSFDLFRKIYKDHKSRIDERSFLQARIFDIWIGDWGRHEDNWKWAGFEDQDQNMIYKPVPRDRDHAFSKWNGILPYLASRKWGLPNAENFDDDFEDISSLTYPARHLDRFILTSLQKEEFLSAAAWIQNTMNDVLIDSAIARLPAEIVPVSGEEIARKLKSRRSTLHQAAEEYYLLLAENVNVTGTNSPEHFRVERLEGGRVEVTVSAVHPDTQVCYRRLFHPDETKNVNVYGLDGDDVFIITGSHSGPIQLRVFGGKGNDSINVSSGRNKKRTRIYDYASDEHHAISASKNAKVILSDDRSIVEYNRNPVRHADFQPPVWLHYSKEDGLEGSLALNYKFHSFGDDAYTNRIKLKGQFSTNGNLSLELADEFHHIIGRMDLLGGGKISDHPYTWYYGAGNETKRMLSREQYRVPVRSYHAYAGLQHIFWRKSSLQILFNYESYKSVIPDLSLLIYHDEMFQKSRLDFFGPLLKVDIDFRDNPFMPRHGARLMACQSLFRMNGTGGNTELLMEIYQTSRTLLPVTFGLMGGLKHTTGKVPFYKMSSLGRTNGLRGYDRNPVLFA